MVVRGDWFLVPGNLTQLALDGSLSELGLTAYEAICGTCYTTN